MEISETTSSKKFQIWEELFALKYSDVFSKLGRSKNHRFYSVFNDPLVPLQEKGRRVLIYIQRKVGVELSKLMKEGHTVKLNKCTSDHFIAPVVITAKKDVSKKLAMDAKPMNVQIFKTQYEMPNLLEQLDVAAQIIKSTNTGSIWFTSLDLKYACSQYN